MKTNREGRRVCLPGRSTTPGHRRCRVGGVNEVAAQVTEGAIYPLGFLLGRSPAPIVTEGHGAKGEFRNPQTRISK
jgi:hypothetical protein